MALSHIVQSAWRWLTLSAGIGRDIGSGRPNDLRILPRPEWVLRRCGKYLIVGAHCIDGFLFHTRLELPDSPNDFVRRDDAESIVINAIDRGAVA